MFNWLYARHHGGKFLLRIEDTDKERSSKEMIDVIFDSLKWLGLEWDEEPVYQSQRIDLYREHVDRLLESGKAYPCWCKPEVLKAKQQEVIKGFAAHAGGLCVDAESFFQFFLSQIVIKTRG